VTVDGPTSARRRLSDLLAREGLDVAPQEGGDAADVVLLWVSDDAAEGDLNRSVAGAHAPVVIVAATTTRRLVQDALASGAQGVVTDLGTSQALRSTLEAVASGQLVVPAEARTALERPLLTAREKQVLSMVVLGFSNLEIANKLYVTETTVKSHLYAAYRKLGVRSRQQATATILDSRDGLGLGVLSLTPAGGS
jgi:two-component system response regulator DesR